MIPLHYFTAFGAFFLATVAAYFSITGLGALYAAAFISIVIMGTAIEYGKIAATFWVHRNWKKSKAWCSILVVVIVASMAVTSGGVYGFLTKGHIDQNTPITDTNLRIERIDNRISSNTSLITREETRLAQLDAVIQTLIDFDKISGKTGARAVRAGQKVERTEIQASIESAYDNIDKLRDQRLEFSQKITEVEAKLGPVKFLAALFQLDTEKTIIYFTLLIVLLLDPFAIMLIVATSMSYDRWRDRQGIKIIDGEAIREVEVIKEIEIIKEVPVEVEVERIVEKEVIKEVIKEVPVEVEKIVEKEVIKEVVVEKIVEHDAAISLESLLQFLEDHDIQQELIDKPELIEEVERLVEEINTRKNPVGWVGDHGNLEFSGKEEE